MGVRGREYPRGEGGRGGGGASYLYQSQAKNFGVVKLNFKLMLNMYSDLIIISTFKGWKKVVESNHRYYRPYARDRKRP